MWAVFVIYSLLFALDYFHISLFLGRDGLYISTYLLLSYLFIGSILPQVKSIFHGANRGEPFFGFIDRAVETRCRT